MRRRLFTSMLVAIGVALLVVGVTFTLLVRQVFDDTTRREMARQAEVIGDVIATELQSEFGRRLTDRTLATLLERALGRDLPGDDVQVRAEFVRFLRALLDQAQRIAGPGTSVHLGWIDPSGRLRVAGEVVPPDVFDVDRLRAGEDVFVRRGTDDGARLLLAHPVDPVPTSDLTLVVVMGRASPVVNLSDLSRPLLVAFVVAALVAAGLAGGLASRLDRQLAGLREAAGRVAAGDLDTRVAEDGDDEIAAVARAFNEMAERLRDAQERERTFLMSVGHDLRTPLTTIRGYAEALEDGAIADPEELARVAAVLGFESDRLRRLVEDVMLLARLEAREFTLRPEPVDVAAHLAELAAGLGDRARRDRVSFEADIAPTGVRLIDPDRLAQIVTNLVENALRYTPEAGTVRLVAAADGGDIRLEVADTGPGIDPADLPHVFDRFYVARRYREVRPEGSGLGLAIVKQLVDAMGGTIEVRSALGEGTRVVVRLPAPPADGATA